MKSLLKIFLITVCSILGGVTAFYGGFSHPAALVDSTVLSWFLATVVIGLLVFSVPTAIAIGVAWRVYKAGAPWQGRLLLCLGLVLLGGGFASASLYSDADERLSHALILAGGAGGLVGAFLIMLLKPHEP